MINDNKRTTKGTVLRTVPFILFLTVALCTPRFSCAAAVAAKTVKDTYAVGEPVKIELTNGSDQAIWSLAKSAAPSSAVRNCEVKNPRGIWDAFFLKSRKGSDAEFKKAGRIKPGETVTFSWMPAVLENEKEIAPEPGLYRLTVIYHVVKSDHSLIFGTAKTNEFQIK